ncbi:MAG: hypothetical protein NC918_08305, partial [Candidatus Omnitrophica bacterium]|nr:hypothetical protein [Candidatus Omnitrophota bacterium]
MFYVKKDFKIGFFVPDVKSDITYDFLNSFLRFAERNEYQRYKEVAFSNSGPDEQINYELLKKIEKLFLDFFKEHKKWKKRE